MVYCKAIKHINFGTQSEWLGLMGWLSVRRGREHLDLLARLQSLSLQGRHMLCVACTPIAPEAINKAREQKGCWNSHFRKDLAKNMAVVRPVNQLFTVQLCRSLVKSSFTT